MYIERDLKHVHLGEGLDHVGVQLSKVHCSYIHMYVLACMSIHTYVCMDMHVHTYTHVRMY